MTKFKNYINESADWEQTIKSLEKQCMPFLKEFDFPIFRGYNKGIQGNMNRKVTRKNRIPRFIPEDVHKDLDNILYKIYGWYPRSNGVFTGSHNVARTFSNNIFLFFPVGKYKYIWTKDYMKIYELYDRLSELSDIEKKDTEEYITLKKELLSIVKNIYSDKNLNNQNGNFEAIFNCESFYLVNPYFVRLHDSNLDFMQNY